jgi:glucose/arabinose dehydrogenase
VRLRARTATLIIVAAALVLAACAGPPDVAEPGEPTDTPAPEVPTRSPGPDDAPCWGMPAPPMQDASPSASAVAFVLEPVHRYFRIPVQILPDPDGRTIVVEKSGRIRALAAPHDLVLDIEDDVVNQNEQGLLGAAFTPDAERLIIQYTEVDTQDTVVREFDFRDGVAVGDGVELWRLPQDHTSHQGGSVLFGPDGYLYLSLGEDFDRPLAQDTSNAYGSIIRVDACEPGQLTAAPGNPDFEEPFVLHYGLRNPYRIWFDDGLLYAPDVGWNDREEINIVPDDARGLNFGWSAFEGGMCQDGPCDLEDLTWPVLEYEHDDTSCAVLGGQVYRGSALPGLVGHFLYGDFCGPTLRTLRFQDGEVVDQQTFDLVIPASFAPDDEFEGLITGFGHDANHEMYIGTNAGWVYRIVPAE